MSARPKKMAISFAQPAAKQLATPKYHYFQGGHTLYGEPQAPLDLAGYLDRPQVVIRVDGNRLHLADYDRWGEPLPEMRSLRSSKN